MNNLYQERKRLFYLLLTLLIVLFLFCYVVLFRPLKEDLSQTDKSVAAMQQDIVVLEQEINSQLSDVEGKDVQLFQLEKKIPRERQLDQIVLMIEQIETISGSRIDNVEFLFDTDIPIEEEEEVSAESDVFEEDSESIDEESEKVQPVILEEKPDNLQLLNVRIEFYSPNEESFNKFIKEIEQQERMMMISDLEFNQPTERELNFSADSDQSIEATIEVTTFYYTNSQKTAEEQG